MKLSSHAARLTLCIFALYGLCLATPQNNIFDTQPIYTPFGLDKFFKDKDKGEIRFHLSPFYQQGSTARDNDGKKVPAGDRLGAWNLFGIFYGTNGAPKAFTGTGNYAEVKAAQTEVQTISTRTQGADAAASSRYRTGALSAAGRSLTEVDATTQPINFQPDKHTFAYINQPLNYEKIGLRSQFSFDFGFGLGVAVKGGIVDVKQKPSQFKFETQFQVDREVIAASEGTTASDSQKTDAKDLYNAFYAPSKFNLIAKDLELDLTPYHKTAVEDLMLQFFWHFPIDLEDKNGDVAVTMVPYISVGGWLPIAEERDLTKPFSVAVGNDGYYGMIAEASIGFDFPVLPKDDQTFQVCIGGGIVGFNSRNQKNVRMYTSDYQAGIVPWKTIISRRPGLLWYLNTSMKAENFIDGLSVYIDYAYTQHMKDDITLLEASTTRKAAFDIGLERFVRETSWKNQQVNLGFDYKVAEALSIGAAVQGHISGVRVYRATTLMGVLSLKL